MLPYDKIASETTIKLAIHRIAGRLNHRFCDRREIPVLMPVMLGSFMFFARLLPYLKFAYDVDYVHATRYADNKPGELTWIKEPNCPYPGRDIVVLDDILDEGITLSAIKTTLLDKYEVASVMCVVLFDKMIQYPKTIKPDLFGLTVPNRYVFGFGLDHQGHERHHTSLYALR
jgi:hypoxanthine phosphoribosyltransferase